MVGAGLLCRGVAAGGENLRVGARIEGKQMFVVTNTELALFEGKHQFQLTLFQPGSSTVP